MTKAMLTSLESGFLWNFLMNTNKPKSLTSYVILGMLVDILTGIKIRTLFLIMGLLMHTLPMGYLKLADRSLLRLCH